MCAARAMKTQLNETGQHFATLFIMGIAMKNVKFSRIFDRVNARRQATGRCRPPGQSTAKTDCGRTKK